MLGDFLKSTLLSLIFIDIFLLSITISDHINSNSDCNWCKTLLPPCCDKTNCDKCRTTIRNIGGRNYIVTYVPALIPYNYAKKYYHDPYMSTIRSKLIPVTIIKSPKNSKHVKFISRNVHYDNAENLPTLIYQHDIQMHRPIDKFFQPLPHLQQQYVPFSQIKINENARLGYGDPQQSPKPLTIDYNLYDDNADLDKISDRDYHFSLIGYGNDDIDNRYVPRINASVQNAYNPPINNVQKVQFNAYAAPSLTGKTPNQKSTIQFHDYPIKYGGVTYNIKPGKEPKTLVSNENAYSIPPDYDDDNLSKLSHILFDTLGIPFDNSYPKKPDQVSQIQINADGRPNAPVKMPTPQFTDNGMHDYNIPFDDIIYSVNVAKPPPIKFNAHPLNADKLPQTKKPDKQSKITINAYSPKIPPANTVKVDKDFIRVPENAHATPYNNKPGKSPTTQFNNAYSPMIPPSPYSQQVDKQPTNNFNAHPLNAYDGPVVIPHDDKPDKQTPQNNKPGKLSTFQFNNAYDPLFPPPPLHNQKVDKQPSHVPENAGSSTLNSDQPGKLSTIQFDQLISPSPYPLDVNKPSKSNSYPVNAYDKPIVIESHTNKPDKQTKITINAYSPKMPPEYTVKVDKDIIHVPENADTTPHNNKPGKSPTVQFINAHRPTISPSPYSLQVDKQPTNSFNAHPLNAYDGPVVIPHGDKLNKQTINAYSPIIPSTQNLDNPSLTNADGKPSTGSVLPQPVLYDDDIDNDFIQGKQPVSINHADVSGQITISSDKIPDDEFIYPPSVIHNVDDDDGSSRISNLDYEDNVPIFDADDYNNDRIANDYVDADNSAPSSSNDKERFFGDLNDWFDYFGGVKLDKNVPNTGLGLNEALTQVQPMYENDKIPSNEHSQFDTIIPKDTDQNLPRNHENAHIKVGNVYNITQNVKVTEKVTNVQDNNADDNPRYKTTTGNNGKVTVTQYADGNNVISVKPTQPIPEPALQKHADEKKKIIEQTPQNNHIFMSISEHFTKTPKKNPNNFGITLDMMKNDQHYQTMKTTNYQKLKKLGSLILHLLKYLNANEKLSNDQIIEHTITDVINGKTDNVIIKDPEIIAYIGWKLLDLINMNSDNSKMLTTLKMILLKILNDANFIELKSFFDGNQIHQPVTHEQRVTYEKKCDCKFEPVVKP